MTPEPSTRNVYVDMLTIVSEHTGVSRADVDRVLTEFRALSGRHPGALARSDKGA